MRKLKHHERKLLKKVDFISWKADKNLQEIKVLRQFRIQKREHYAKYCKLSSEIHDLLKSLLALNVKDPFRIKASAQLLAKLHNMGLIPDKSSLSNIQKVGPISFCRRRLPVVMVRSGMVERLETAVKFVEQGHVRVGPTLITDPAYLVTRNMEDFITWTHTSAIRKHVMQYNELRDDFDTM